MLPISTAAQVRALDERTIHGLGLPGPVLMENAGRLATQALLEHLSAQAGAGVAILCGRGNNGGDGYVMARLLSLRGFKVRVFALGEPTTSDASLNRLLCERLGVSIEPELSLEGVGLVVDAMLGTGLSSALRGRVAEWVERVGASGLPVLSVDIPTGLDADRGQVLGTAIQASVTATFGRLKSGFFLGSGPDICGRIVLCDIGLGAGERWRGDPERIKEIKPELRLPLGTELQALLPRRARGGHKGDSGRLVVIAGSPERAGAAVLTANAAMRSGCGLVTLSLSADAWSRLGSLRPEVMVESPHDLDPTRFDAMVVGPGLGTSAETRERCRRLWTLPELPALFDADALTALVGATTPPSAPRLVTPHPGEAGRLLCWSTAQIQSDRLGALRALQALPALSEQTTVLLKGRYTLISSSTPWVNPTGSARLSTAGSGDVLSGICGALLARGLDPEQAALCGAFLHGHAGDLACAGESPILAGDIIEALPRAFGTVSERGGPFQQI